MCWNLTSVRFSRKRQGPETCVADRNPARVGLRVRNELTKSFRRKTHEEKVGRAGNHANRRYVGWTILKLLVELEGRAKTAKIAGEQGVAIRLSLDGAG